MGVLLAGYLFIPTEIKEGYHLMETPTNQPYEEIWTTKISETLKLQITPDGKIIRILDHTDPDGGKFIIKNYKQITGKDSASISGEGYLFGQTVNKNGDLKITIPHFSMAEITPIYSGINYMGRHEAPQTTTYGIYLNNTWTNGTIIFRGHNLTDHPAITIGGKLFGYQTTLANGTYYNISVPNKYFIPGEVNRITVRTLGGGVDWGIHGEQTGFNTTWNIERKDWGVADEVEWHNLTFEQYADFYIQDTYEDEYGFVSDIPILGDYTGDYTTLDDSGIFTLSEVNASTYITHPSIKNALDDSGDTITDLIIEDQSGVGPDTMVINDGWYTLDYTDIMSVSGFSTAGINGTITGVRLRVKYSVESGSVANNYIQWNTSSLPLVNTNIQPTSGDLDIVAGYDLFALGVANISEIQNLTIQYTNDDVPPDDNEVNFDYIAIQITYTHSNNHSSRHLFQTEPIESGINSITLRAIANVSSVGDKFHIGLFNITEGIETPLFNITATTPTLYTASIPLCSCIGEPLYIGLGSYSAENDGNATVTIRSITIEYNRTGLVVNPLIDYEWKVGLTDASHHTDVLNITYDGTNYTLDTSNYDMNETNDILSVYLGTIAKMNTYTLNVSVKLDQNEPPVLSHSVKASAIKNVKYEQVFSATDPEGDDLEYTFHTDATWIDFDEQNGTISGKPTSTGTFYIYVMVTDEYGGSDTYLYELVVQEHPFIVLMEICCTSLSGIACSGSTLVIVLAIAGFLYKIYSERKKSQSAVRKDEISMARDRKEMGLLGRMEQNMFGEIKKKNSKGKKKVVKREDSTDK